MTITINDEGLLKRVEDIRDGQSMQKEVWLETMPKEGSQTILLKESF